MASRLRAETLMMLGKLHLRRMKYAKALECYRNVTQLQPQNATAFAKLGYCLAALGCHRDALDAYECALQIRPDFTAVYAHFSMALERLGDTQSAAEYMERALRSSVYLKDSTAAAYWHHQLGVMYCKLGDWEGSVIQLRSAAEGNPNETVLCNLGGALWHTGDKDGCVVAYKRATDIDSKSVEGHYGQGWAFYNLKRYAEAVAPLCRAIELNPKHADAQYHLGLVLLETGKLEEASRTLKQAAKLRPEHAETHYALGATFAAQNRFADALDSYLTVVRLRPDYAEAHFNIGVAYSELGQPEEEIEAYKTALSFNEMDITTWGNLALAYSGQHMYSGALRAYGKLCELQPDNEMGFYGVASSLTYLERRDEAVQNFQEAIRIDPSFVAAHEYLGWTYAGMGRFSEALDCYGSAMSLAPNSAQLHSELSEIYEEMGNAEVAQQLRSKADDLRGNAVDPAVPNPKKPINKHAPPHG
jgi:tetratricopeptide (TPR) repeat protein